MKSQRAISSTSTSMLNPALYFNHVSKLQNYTPFYDMIEVTLHDGQTMPVLRVGNPANTPVIMIHGYGMDTRNWLLFTLPHLKDFCFYLPFLRGFAAARHVKSSQPDIVLDYINDIRCLREQYQLDEVIQVGFSMGGVTSLRSAQYGGFDGVIKYLNIDQTYQVKNTAGSDHGLFGSNQIEKYTGFREVVNRMAAYHDLDYADLPAEIKKEINTLMCDFLKSAVKKPVFQLSIDVGNAIYYRFDKLFVDANWQHMIHGICAFMEQDYDLRPGLKNITCPTTVFIGTHSEMYSVESQLDLVRQLPNAKAVLFKKSGHTVFLDQPFYFARKFKDFLEN